MKTRLSLVILLLLSPLSFAGGTVDVALTTESVRAEHGAVRAGTGMYLTVGGWYHLDNGTMINLGFHAVDPNNTRPELVAGLGGKTYLFRTSGHDTTAALGLGGFLRYQPTNLNGFGVELAAYYAPPVLSFAKLNQFTDVQARVGYQIIPQGSVFLGVSYLEADYDPPTLELDTTFVVGFRVSY